MKNNPLKAISTLSLICMAAILPRCDNSENEIDQDIKPPIVTTIEPEDGATLVTINTRIYVGFSERMDPSTINAETFLVGNGVGGDINMTVTGKGAGFHPTYLLDYNTEYDVRITTGVKDVAGNAMEAEYTWSFTTEPEPWTQLIGTPENERAIDIEIDSNDNIFIAGSSGGDFDGHTNAGKGDVYIAKYNPSGSKEWTQLFGTEEYDAAAGLALDSLGNIYVAGKTSGNLDGNINAGEDDIFLAKFDASGVREWTKGALKNRFTFSQEGEME